MDGEASAVASYSLSSHCHGAQKKVSRHPVRITDPGTHLVEAWCNAIRRMAGFLKDGVSS